MKRLFKNIGPAWVQTSVPFLSPDKKIMAFTTENQIIIRDVSYSLLGTWDVRSEKSLWSWDSRLLAIYASDRKIYVALPNGSDLQEIYSLSVVDHLEDWIWLSNNQHILLILQRSDGSRLLRVLSVRERRLIQ